MKCQGNNEAVEIKNLLQAVINSDLKLKDST